MSNEAAKLLKGIGDPESKGWILSSIDVRGPEVALRNRLGKNSLISGIDRYRCQNRQVSILSIPVRRQTALKFVQFAKRARAQS
jgi:hypothetical protein